MKTEEKTKVPKEMQTSGPGGGGANGRGKSAGVLKKQRVTVFGMTIFFQKANPKKSKKFEGPVLVWGGYNQGVKKNKKCSQDRLVAVFS